MQTNYAREKTIRIERNAMNDRCTPRYHTIKKQLREFFEERGLGPRDAMSYMTDFMSEIIDEYSQEGRQEQSLNYLIDYIKTNLNIIKANRE